MTGPPGPGGGSITLATPHDRIIRHVITLLTSPDLGQLHQCEDAACGWVYLDTFPRHNRRWCSAADCGNRNRARRYYTRQRSRTTPSRIDGCDPDRLNLPNDPTP